MSEPALPSVCCVMLADGRPEMVRRAVRCFELQDYSGKKCLLVYDTGHTTIAREILRYARGIFWARSPQGKGRPIGALRNGAQQWVSCHPLGDVVLVWDSDDWSHPARIREQVAFLQASKAEAVGYNRILAWDSRGVGEAWLYQSQVPNYVVGASLCYWRRVGEQHPFREVAHGSDTFWVAERKVQAGPSGFEGAEPRLIAGIHGANTTAAIIQGAPEWKRAPEFDGYCRERMAAQLYLGLEAT